MLRKKKKNGKNRTDCKQRNTLMVFFFWTVSALREMLWASRSIIFLILRSLMDFSTAKDRCRIEVNIPGMALKGFVFKRISATAPHVCDIACEREVICQSYNYVTADKVCELNNRTKEASVENFRSDEARFYIRRMNGRGTYSLLCSSCLFILKIIMKYQHFSCIKKHDIFTTCSITLPFSIPAPLGSIPELPALSCREIKLSEGQDSLSKTYWLDPTGIGKAVLVYCDMKMKGKEHFLW